MQHHRGSEEMEIPGDKSTDSVYLLCLVFDFCLCLFISLFIYWVFFLLGGGVCVIDLLFMCVCMLAFYYQMNPAIGGYVYIARGCYWLCEGAGDERV